MSQDPELCQRSSLPIERSGRKSSADREGPPNTSLSYWFLGFGWILLSFALLAFVVWLDVRQAQLNFNERADLLYDGLLQRIRVNEVVLAGFAAHFPTSCGMLGRVEGYARDMLERYPRIYMMEAQCKVSQSGLDGFQKRMHAAGYKNYKVRTFTYDADRSWRKVAPHALHYPVFFMEPVTPDSAPVLGLDVYSVPHLRRAIDEVARTRRAVASAPFELIEGGRAFVLFRPVRHEAILVDIPISSNGDYPDVIVSLVIRTQELFSQLALPDGTFTLNHSAFEADDPKGWLYHSAGAEVGRLARLILPTLIYSRGFEADGQDFALRITREVDWDVVNVPVLMGLSAFVVLTSLTLAFYVRRRHDTETQRNAERKRTRQYLDIASVILVVLDREGNVSLINERGCRVLGFSAEQLLGRNWFETCLPERERNKARNVFEQVMAEGLETAEYQENPVVTRRGVERLIAWRNAYLKDADGKISGTLSSGEDVTERRQAEHALSEERERAQVTLHSIADAVIRTNAEGSVEYLNPVAESLTGWTAEQAQGRALSTVLHIADEESDAPIARPLDWCLGAGYANRQRYHSILLGTNGRRYTIQLSAAYIRERNGAPIGAVFVFQDVTKSRLMARQIAHNASHDSLTGLVNRREFEQRLQRVLESARTEQSVHALCYLDLDQFKIINDTCGHVAGDELLRQVGNVLRAHVRKRDTLARLGGDEFGVLMEHCTMEQATRVADALRRAIEGFRFLWQEKRFGIAASFGLVPITDLSGGISSVLRAADSACYAAKDAGRNRVHVYHEADTVLARRHGEMQWVTRIPRALEEDRFRLYLQPIARIKGLDGNKGHHYELLLRLKDEEGRIVLPRAFLPVAERYAFAPKIDRWVVSTTLSHLARQPDHLERLFLCAINVSGHSLADREFLGFVTRKLEETQVPPEKLCFEITETAAIANLADATRFIKVLKGRGCRFALDDFASGLSSFAYLKNLPVDFIKIDGAFVKGIVGSHIDQALVSSIQQIAHVMGKQTIAEYVENQTILEKLRALGVDYAQGYALGHPEPFI